jgi:hypothetical protein
LPGSLEPRPEPRRPTIENADGSGPKPSENHDAFAIRYRVLSGASAGGLATAWPIAAVTIDLAETMAITAAQNIWCARQHAQCCPDTLKQRQRNRQGTFALTGPISALLYL